MMMNNWKTIAKMGFSSGECDLSEATPHLIEFLKSVIHPELSVPYPDGMNQNFIMKPIKSSASIHAPDSGEFTAVIYPSNPLGRIVEVFFWDADTETYSVPTLYNQSQILSSIADYARGFGWVSIESDVIAAGQFQINGIAVGTRFLFPPGEKQGTGYYDKFSYKGLVGVQSDPNSLESGVRMNEGIVFTELPLLGRSPIRISDSIVTSDPNTTVIAIDGTNDLNYSCKHDALPGTVTLVPNVPVNYSSGKILLTAIGGISVNATHMLTGSFSGGTPGDQIPLTYVIEIYTYDLMGNAIDFFDYTQDTSGISGDTFGANATTIVNLPLPGQLLSKPVISQVQFKLRITQTGGVNYTLTTPHWQVFGNVIAHEAAYQGGAIPSYMYAVAQAEGQTFNIEAFQVFEATPNSDIAITTTTITYPQGDVLQTGIYYKMLASCMDSLHWRYVWKKSFWDKIRNDDDHPLKIIQWQGQLPQVLDSYEGGDMSGAKRFFRGLGRHLERGGRKAGKALFREGKRLAPILAPRALKLLDQVVATVAPGLSPYEKQASAYLLKGVRDGDWSADDLVKGLSNSAFDAASNSLTNYAANRTQQGGSLAGGRLAGGRLAGEDKVQSNVRRLLGYTAGKNTPIKVDKAVDVKDTISITFNETRGIFIPAIFFDEDNLVKASALYYLFQNVSIYQKFAKLGKWTVAKDGNLLVGHSDPTGLQYPIPPNCVLISLAQYEGTGNATITGNLNSPATGRSVELGLAVLKAFNNVKTLPKCPFATTGVLNFLNGTWHVEHMPAVYAWYKKQAVMNILGPVPLVMNSALADIQVQTVAEAKKQLHITAASGGICAGDEKAYTSLQRLLLTMLVAFQQTHPDYECDIELVLPLIHRIGDDSEFPVPFFVDKSLMEVRDYQGVLLCVPKLEHIEFSKYSRPIPVMAGRGKLKYDLSNSRFSKGKKKISWEELRGKVAAGKQSADADEINEIFMTLEAMADSIAELKGINATSKPSPQPKPKGQAKAKPKASAKGFKNLTPVDKLTEAIAVAKAMKKVSQFLTFFSDNGKANVFKNASAFEVLYNFINSEQFRAEPSDLSPENSAVVESIPANDAQLAKFAKYRERLDTKPAEGEQSGSSIQSLFN